MKILFHTAIFFLLVIAGTRFKEKWAIPYTPVSGTAIFCSPADTGTLKGTWFLQAVLPSDTATGKIPEISFNLAKNTFNGNTGCNNMNGGFQRTDTSLVFNERIITTKMNCTGYNETAFIKSLLRTNRYKIENGVLILLFDATELSRWTRTPDRKPKMNRT